MLCIRKVFPSFTWIIIAHGLIYLCSSANYGDSLEEHSFAHAFFYLWYGTPEVDGRWLHWDHEVLPHWHEHISRQYPVGSRFKPPIDLHSPFFPSRGPYSSSHLHTLESQLGELRSAGVGVVAVSWWGRADHPGTHDTQGVNTDTVLPLLLQAANNTGVKVAFHLEPYPGRSAASVREDVLYLAQHYQGHQALLTLHGRPLYYVYDSYHIPASEWAEVLQPGGSKSLRGGAADAVFIGLWLNREDGDLLKQDATGQHWYRGRPGRGSSSCPQWDQGTMTHASGPGTQLRLGIEKGVRCTSGPGRRR